MLYIHRSARKISKVVFRKEKEGKKWGKKQRTSLCSDRLLRVCLRSPLRLFSISETSDLLCFGHSVFEECCFLLWAIVMLPDSHSYVFWTQLRKHNIFHHWCLLPLESLHRRGLCCRLLDSVIMLIIELRSILFIFTSLWKRNCCARVVSPVMSKLRETMNLILLCCLFFSVFCSAGIIQSCHSCHTTNVVQFWFALESDDKWDRLKKKKV